MTVRPHRVLTEAHVLTCTRLSAVNAWLGSRDQDVKLTSMNAHQVLVELTAPALMTLTVSPASVTGDTQVFRYCFEFMDLSVRVSGILLSDGNAN